MTPSEREAAREYQFKRCACGTKPKGACPDCQPQIIRPQSLLSELDKSRLEAAFEAYWAAEGGTFKGIEAAILSYLNGQNDIVEKCAKIAEPNGPRPCDCERCDCHNQGDAEAVARWDADMATAKAIRALKHLPRCEDQMSKIAHQVLDAVGFAIDAARCPSGEGPYGLFDYTSYGWPKPHRVRDFRDTKSKSYGADVFVSDDRDEARAEFERLRRHHLAQAAIDAYHAGLQHISQGLQPK